MGGGILNLEGTLTVNHSQVTGNTAAGLGGGILEDGVNPHDTLGQPGGPLTVQHIQVTGNSAAQGGGIYASTGSPVMLQLSQILGNGPNSCYPPGTVPGCNTYEATGPAPYRSGRQYGAGRAARWS